MKEQQTLRAEVELAIRSAFRGVRLGAGVSMKQAEVIDRFGEGVSEQEYDALPQTEITDDWSAVPLESLEGGFVAHLDAEGFRFYIPACMLSVLTKYDDCSLRVISTLSSLYPKRDGLWDHHLAQYSLLDRQQRYAIATYLAALPALLDLSQDDRFITERALRNYWHHFLPDGPTAPGA